MDTRNEQIMVHELKSIKRLLDYLAALLAPGGKSGGQLMPLVEVSSETIVLNETISTPQTVKTLVIPSRTLISAIWIDMVNVTQDTIISVHHCIDGVNHRRIGPHYWKVAKDDDGVLLRGTMFYSDVLIVMQSTGDGAGNVNVVITIV